ncbi:unnamed protein product [Mytilus edulis]|uniref:DZIP3-like HEPN domain-containing protein n=1 Tax=Mytilus edulis TaxID=6550 RepID=A0A8S3SM00_MYTED|nr:unnamed protein product [Mytilus edulis]
MVLLLRHLADIAVGDCMPLSTDVRPAADLFRIKHYRNKIAHLDNQVFSGKEFDEEWTQISMAIQRLGGYGFVEECDVLKTAEFDATKEYENLQFINTKNRLTLMEDTMSQLMQNISLIEMERCIPTDLDNRLNMVSLVKPFRIIATCRLEISESPEFASLRHVSRLTECNISADFQSSMTEMRQIALCHLDSQSVELLIQKNIHQNEKFYTLCYLSSRLIEQIDLDF